MPIAHETHAGEAEVEAYLPGSQDTQTTFDFAPTLDENCPAAHAKHLC